RGGAQHGGGARRLRGDADWLREIAVLPIAGGARWRTNGGGDIAADSLDARPSGATGANGDSGGICEQLTGWKGTKPDSQASDGRKFQVVVFLSGTSGLGGYTGVAEADSGVVLCD